MTKLKKKRGKKKNREEICRVNRKGMAITLVGAKEECLQEFFFFFFVSR